VRVVLGIGGGDLEGPFGTAGAVLSGVGGGLLVEGRWGG